MRHKCGCCGMTLTPLAPGVHLCLRCDTSAQNNGMRVGPPNTPGTRNGWFRANFPEK